MRTVPALGLLFALLLPSSLAAADPADEGARTDAVPVDASADDEHASPWDTEQPPEKMNRQVVIQSVWQHQRELDAQREQIASLREELEQIRAELAEIRGGAGERTQQATSEQQKTRTRRKQPPPRKRTLTRHTIYHLWATHCGPCIHELPTVISWAKTLPSEEVRVVFVAEEYDGAEKKARAVFTRKGGDGLQLEIEPVNKPPTRRRLGIRKNDQPVTALAINNERRFTRIGTLRAGDYETMRGCLDQSVKDFVCE